MSEENNLELLIPELQRALARHADAQPSRLERLVIALIQCAPFGEKDKGRPVAVAEAIMAHARALDAEFPKEAPDVIGFQPGEALIGMGVFNEAIHALHDCVQVLARRGHGGKHEACDACAAEKQGASLCAHWLGHPLTL